MFNGKPKNTVHLYDIHGVKAGSQEITDHPQFPNPRKEQGDLEALAHAIAASGGLDQAITCWRRGKEVILGDGKRRVLACLRHKPLLGRVIGEDWPVTWWEAAGLQGFTPEQEFLAFMARVNVDPSHTTSGRKFLTLAEEMAGAAFLKKSGLKNEQVGKIMNYTDEFVRTLLKAEEAVVPEVKAAAAGKDEPLTVEKPLSRTQVISMAKQTPVEQVETLQKAKSAVIQIKAAGKEPTPKAVSQAIGGSAKSRMIQNPGAGKRLSRVESEARKAAQPSPAKPQNVGQKATSAPVVAVQPAKAPEIPKTFREVLEDLLSALSRAMDADQLGSIVREVKAAQRSALQLRDMIPAEKKSKAA